VFKNDQVHLKVSGDRYFKSDDRFAVKRFLSKQTFDYYIF